MPQYPFLVLEASYFILGVLALKNILKNWRENKNRALLAISVYMVAILARSLLDVLIYFFDLNLDLPVIGYLLLGTIIGNVLFIIQLEFMFYLQKLTKLYTLPPIIAFYLMAGRAIIDSSVPFIIYAMIVGYGSAFFLIKEGRQKRNGLAVGMGLFFLFWAIGQTIPVETFFVASRLIAMISLYLGTRGFYEKYVFPDMQQEEKIISTWISKIVVKE